MDVLVKRRCEETHTPEKNTSTTLSLKRNWEFGEKEDKKQEGHQESSLKVLGKERG